MKKHLKTIALYGGSFVLLNVAMFFVLKFTQPVPAPSELSLAHVDSASTAEAHGDSLFTEEAEHAADEHSTTEHDSVNTPTGELTHVDHVAQDSTVADAQVEQSPAHAEDAAAGEQQESSQSDEALNNETESESYELADDSGATASAPEEQRSTAEIAKLAKLLEGMKPAEAATIAEGLPTDTIVELVMRMKARSGAKMMASLPVPVAASVAERMAELSGAKKSS